MAINLDEHKIFNYELKIMTVPLSVAKRAVDEAAGLQEYQVKLDEALKMMNDAFKDINNSVEEIDD